MKEFYTTNSIHIVIILISLLGLMRMNGAMAFAADRSLSASVMRTAADTTDNPRWQLVLKDNRKNKPKIFQDPVKTYDSRQLLFFTTFGFQDYHADSLKKMKQLQLAQAIEAEKIISNFKVFPNPLYVNSQSLKISYNIKKNALVTVKMLDVLGNEVSTLYTERVRAGHKTGEFNISSKVSGGFYFIRLSADNDHVTKKISVVQ